MMQTQDKSRFANRYRIESNRNAFWDYSRPGSYFITIVTKNRAHLFGRILHQKMIFSRYGVIAHTLLPEIISSKEGIRLDEYVIMPDHIHALISILESKNAQKCAPATWKYHKNYAPTACQIKQYRKSRRRMLIPMVIGKYKMQVAKQINQIRNTSGHPVWQPNYHDHIVRNEFAFQNIKKYIRDNPKNWVAYAVNGY